jgi:hypothetical protein
VTRAQRLRRLGRLLAGTLLASALFAERAVAACGDEARVTCRAEFETLGTIVRSGDGFTAAGQIRANPTAVGLIRLTRAGTARGNILPVPLPQNFTGNRQVASEPRKLIGLPNGDVVLLSQILISEGAAVRQVAWAARIAPNDRILWSRAFPDNAASTIFHSGLYEANSDRLILVGRRTNGGDPQYRCENWSQSLVLPLAAATGQPSPSLTTFGQATKSLTNRQAIYDITPGERAGTYAVAGFQSARHSDTDGCQDNILVGTLTSANNSWSLAPQSIGAPNANEVAFAIRAIGDGRTLVTGQGRDQAGAPAAQAYRLRFAPFAIEGLLNTEFARDGASGRFRLIVPLDWRRLLLGGQVIYRDQSTRGMWQIVSADLSSSEPLRVLDSPGASDLLHAVVAPDGRVLAVGKWTDDGRAVGWFGFIGESPAPAGATARRTPDSRLPRLSTLQASNGLMQLPTSALSAGAAYFERELKADVQFNLTLSVAARSTVTFSAYPESGDVDLVLTGAGKRLVAFTNFRKSATEYMTATLPPGDYQLAIVVQSAVPSLEFRVAPSAGTDSRATAKLERLNDEQRRRFAATLTAAGYSPPANPDIALGGESVRAFLAIQEGAQREIEPGEIDKLIAR